MANHNKKEKLALMALIQQKIDELVAYLRNFLYLCPVIGSLHSGIEMLTRLWLPRMASSRRPRKHL